MALLAQRSVYPATKWDDMLRRCVTEPAGIEAAPTWTGDFSDGRFTFDYNRGGIPNPDFPGLSWSLGASPVQYAQFASAFLANKLVSAAGVAEMTRSHGSTDGFGNDMAAFANYGQGMWVVGSDGGRKSYPNVTHSLGYQGFYPWLDRSAVDPAEHFFGVLALDNERHWQYGWAIGLGVGLPFALIGCAVSVYVLKLHERLRRSWHRHLSQPHAQQPQEQELEESAGVVQHAQVVPVAIAANSDGCTDGSKKTSIA